MARQLVDTDVVPAAVRETRRRRVLVAQVVLTVRAGPLCPTVGVTGSWEYAVAMRSRRLAGMVVVAVAGSLAATLLAAPRMYLAMSRDGLFPGRLVRFDEARGSAAGATLVQVGLACVLIGLGTFEQVLGYFVPITIFFLGLSAAAVLRLPRPADDGRVFVMPWHPAPIALFLLLIGAVLLVFVLGQPIETLIGAGVAALGVPASFLFRSLDY